ncbi:hypothetical protein GQ600_6749 [Phytophthora cactorum]|nr:hypothetical protein GQ600_6749 [Phytophthora cactorum]
MPTAPLQMKTTPDRCVCRGQESDWNRSLRNLSHLLSIRNTSKRIHYKIDVHAGLEGFTLGQTCYGVADMVEKNEHFYFQPFNTFSFGGLQTQLRKFAMEAAQVDTEAPAIKQTQD